MLGLSLAETAVILLVALLVIGPKELPKVVRLIARGLAQLRGLGKDVREQFDALAEEAQLKDIQKEFEDSVPRPMIIDLEGNEQPTYDIPEEMCKKEEV